MRLFSWLMGSRQKTHIFHHTEGIYNKVRHLYQNANVLYHLGKKLDRIHSSLSSKNKIQAEKAAHEYKQAVQEFHKFKLSYLNSLTAIRAHLEEIEKQLKP